MKKTLSLILAALMIIALVGCGGKKRQPIQLTLNTEDSQAILAAAGIKLPDISEAKGANSSITYFGWVDFINNYTEDQIINTGYWTFREKYGGKVVFSETTYQERYDKLATLIMGGDAPDFFPAGVSSEATFPMYCVKGTFQPVDQYVDYTDPLWEGMAEAAEAFALGSRHFAFVTDITFRNVCPYNRRVVVDDWGFEDPAELYANDEWTWSKFYDMCMEFSDEESDRFGVEGDAYNGALVQEATGRKIIHKDEDGNYYADVDDPVIEAANNLLYDLRKNGCCYHKGNSYWAGRNDPKVPGNAVKDGLTLFYITYFTDIQGPVDEIATTWGDITQGEVMFVPLPRYDDGDGEYYLASIPTGYMLVSHATNPDGVALFASCERFKYIDPTVDRIDRRQLQEKYQWSQEMLDMYDECRRLILKNAGMYLNGNLTDSANDAYNAFRDLVSRSNTETSWAQVKEQYKDQLDYYLEDMNVQIKAYIDSIGTESDPLGTENDSAN